MTRIHVGIPGASPSETEYPPTKSNEQAKKDPKEMTAKDYLAQGYVRCKNYGCNAWFKEDENEENNCRHHIKPPIFHDTKKGWSCCMDRLVYDWKDFETIKGCTLASHSTVDPKLKFAPSPTVTNAVNAEKKCQNIKSIDSYNQSNPNGVTAALKMKETLQKKVKAQWRDDGTTKCILKGCQKWYNPSDNSDTACVYHPSQPVFHDTIKYWSCCEGNKAYDFDSFLKIKGCKTGRHYNGEE